MKRKYYEVMIKPGDAGFGEYVADYTDTGGECDYLPYLLAEIRQNVGALFILKGEEASRFSDDSPPASMRNILGAIHNEPPIVYAFTYLNDPDRVYYGGIDWND